MFLQYGTSSSFTVPLIVLHRTSGFFSLGKKNSLVYVYEFRRPIKINKNNLIRYGEKFVGNIHEYFHLAVTLKTIDRIKNQCVVSLHLSKKEDSVPNVDIRWKRIPYRTVTYFAKGGTRYCLIRWHVLCRMFMSYMDKNWDSSV